MTEAEQADHLRRVQTDGYTIIADVLSAAEADGLGEALCRIEAEEGIVPAQNLFEGLRTVRIYNLLARGEPFTAIPTHPRVLPLVEGVLDRGCLVSSISSIAIDPDESPQPMHADDQLIPLPRPHVPIVCNTMWAITDFTADNGATRLIPGSHLRDSPPEPFASYETIPAVMRKGSVLIYNGSLWHGGGANRSGARRIGVAMNYCAGWVRQQENQLLGIPPEVARGFSPRLRKLVGYGLYRGLLGHIDKCNPADLLDGVRRKVVGT